MQSYTCLLKHTFCLIITKWNIVGSLVSVTPLLSVRTEKNDHVPLGTLNAPLFSQEE